MTAKEAYREHKMDSPRIGRWLKWAAQRFLPAGSARVKAEARKAAELGMRRKSDD